MSFLNRLFGRTSTELAIPVKGAMARLDLTAAAKTRTPYATAINVTTRFSMADPRRGARMLRNFSRQNEFVRIAIERRRDQISQASWRIVRFDDPEKPADPGVIKRFSELARNCNPLGMSFAQLLDMVVEDILVLDAGCIEKEKTLGGDLVALYPVDGSTIVPDPNWDGKPREIRYRQYINSRLEAELRSDQLVYIENNPTTYSPIGWSPVETLVRVIEAELYGEEYDGRQLRKPAPGGIINLGTGVTPENVDDFRQYFGEELSGGDTIAIYGGGDPGAGTGLQFIPLAATSKDQERMAYKHWLAKKIASVFKLDPMIFGITADTNRSTSKTQKEQTDEGHVTFATRLQNYLTRNIVWEIDEQHAFQFDDLTPRDEAQQSEIDKTYLSVGVWTINEVRARDGLKPVPWGDEPYVASGMASPEPPTGGSTPPKPGDPEAAKGLVPFARARARTAAPKDGYLNS